MNVPVYRRALGVGWKGLLITAGSVALMLVLGLAVYGSFDLSIYDRLPEALRALVGIPTHADPALMAYNEMLAAIGALAFVGVAIAIGAQAVAGEEADRTLALTLATPVTRVSYVLSRAAALVTLLIGGGLLLWAIAEAAPRIMGIEVGQAHLFALVLHLTCAAIFHGILALSIGAATGRKGVAAGVASGVMVLGWLGSSLLPMWREGSAEWLPWNWFNGSQPLVNGVSVKDIALLLGGALVLLILGTTVFRSRELRLLDPGSNLVSRLREMPALAKILAPTGKGSSLLGLRLAAQQVLVGYVVFILAVVMGFGMPFMYRAMGSTIGDFSASFPQTMLDMFGGGSLATTAGFMHLEVFGMVAPAAVIVVGAVAASSGIAGEERFRRMSLLLAQPISRARTYWTVAAAMALYVVFVSVALFLGTWAGTVVSGQSIQLNHLFHAVLLLALLGCFFGALTLLVAAATGRSSSAVWTTTAIAVATYFGYTLLLAAGHEGAAWWSPFRPYLYGPPLMEGMEWWQPVWLALGTVVLVVAGWPLFARRDIRISAG